MELDKAAERSLRSSGRWQGLKIEANTPPGVDFNEASGWATPGASFFIGTGYFSPDPTYMELNILTPYMLGPRTARIKEKIMEIKGFSEPKGLIGSKDARRSDPNNQLFGTLVRIKRKGALLAFRELKNKWEGMKSAFHDVISGISAAHRAEIEDSFEDLLVWIMTDLDFLKESYEKLERADNLEDLALRTREYDSRNQKLSLDVEKMIVLTGDLYDYVEDVRYFYVIEAIIATIGGFLGDLNKMFEWTEEIVRETTLRLAIEKAQSALSKGSALKTDVLW